MERDVTVVIGIGAMGQAIARRIGPGTQILIADVKEAVLRTVAGELEGEGYVAATAVVDVTSRESVTALARHAASLGPVRSMVHTAGLSPAQAPVPAVLAVDLLGVALVLEEFAHVVAPGAAGVVIASMAGHLAPPIAPDVARALATTPASELLALPAASPDQFPDSGQAYTFAKRANQIRVQAASTIWGAHGARINSISPGVIATPMSTAELATDHGGHMQMMIDVSNAKRLGTPADIAAATEFLLSPAASFLSGTDLLVDGGAVAAIQTGKLG
ncbi:SDR family oxidoreductase [Frankia sp. CNm7]|uniref:SDR family oxidoreductase n=1 Tax=Frankia nepalensis TaxID=1836974 RepID=A0A937RL97_9ACTN|nr:SDR family oxidoreductase [Frankia nepalensis]MBL7499668.1 SDR family oxidoreductase [Frankia nepalensis]MBL7514640.1 SDR family oxidoreductase [Frankia nepalensis]MBL7522613.1 SDR family oxidoreductase [Frankia nepalensis]MBL7629394.1 SDR family oxidoreductase [Frankia nepalensis]